MTTPTIALFTFSIVIVLIEIVARTSEARTVVATQVSTDRNSDHTLSRLEQRVRLGGLIGTALFALGAYTAGGQPIILAPMVVFFAVFRLALIRLNHTAALASQEERLVAALKSPAFSQAPIAFFFAAPDLRTPDHLRAWENEVCSIEVPWFCLTPERHHFATLRQEGKTEAVFLPDLNESLELLPPNLKAILYANNTQKNRLVIGGLPDLMHVQLLHGDSDKPPSYSPLTKNYDRVFVAGQMAIDRYANNAVYIPPERFRIVGRPQVASLLSGGRSVTNHEGDSKQIVYMPTWRGFYEDTQYSSLDRADRVIDALFKLPEKVHVIFKPHPLSYKDPEWSAFKKRIDAALKQGSKLGSTGEVSSSELTAFDLYNRADLLLCDISSVMIDFLYTNKPLLTLLPPSFQEEDRHQFPSLAASYEVTSCLSNIREQLLAATGDDPLRPIREQVRSSAFGDLDQLPGEAFRAACHELIHG